MAKRAYNEAEYLAERKRLLAGRPSCAYCPRRATSADHQPPLCMHFHRQGSKCCTLVPSCKECSLKQGGTLKGIVGVRKSRASIPIADDPDGFDVDSPVWDVAWLTKLRDVPSDGWWPRLMTVPHPDAVGSWGGEVVEFALVERGITLHWWQQLVLARLLEHDANLELVWRDAFLSVARQSGKSVLVSVLGDWRSEQSEWFGEAQLVMHTADTLRHALDVWQLGVPRANEHGWTVRRGAGTETIVKPCGGSWVVRSQTAVVGSSVSLGLADEAHGIKLSTITENLSPTLVEKVQSQMLLVSTAHSACTDLMPTYRLQATQDLAAPHRLLVVEWSAAPTLELGDPVAARQASPRWSKGRERDIGEAVTRAAATPAGHELRVGVDAQWYNRWPSLSARSGPGELLLAEGAWAACEGKLRRDPIGPGIVAIEDAGFTAAGAGVVFVAWDGDRYEIDGVACDTWDEAMDYARKFRAISPGSRLLVGASMMTSVPQDMYGQALPARGVEARRGLAVLKRLVADGLIVHDRTTQLDIQVAAARVRPSSDGMQLAPAGRQDLLRAALWAVWAAQEPTATNVVH